MARASWFDAQIRPSGWFDPELAEIGWVDLTIPTAAPAIALAASSNIADGGAATTAQLTVPNSHTFGGGRIQDDVNPGTAVDLGASNYREDEWSIWLTADAYPSDVYEFRLVLADGSVLDVYSYTPQLTVSERDGSATFTVTASGTGAANFTGSGASSFTVTATATGAANIAGSGAASVSFTASGSGVADITGSGASSVTFTPTGTSLADKVASGSSSVSFTPSGSGVADATGSGSSSVSFTASGTGAENATGSGAASVSFTTSGVGDSSTTVTTTDTGPGSGKRRPLTWHEIHAVLSSHVRAEKTLGLSVQFTLGRPTVTITPKVVPVPVAVPVVQAPLPVEPVPEPEPEPPPAPKPPPIPVPVVVAVRGLAFSCTLQLHTGTSASDNGTSYDRQEHRQALVAQEEMMILMGRMPWE